MAIPASLSKAVQFGWELLKVALIALAIVVPVRMFLFQPFIVRGASMEPNFHTGDYLIVDELSYNVRSPERGEVVVFKYPKDVTQRYIKRVIGLPAETVAIRDGLIFINGTADGKELVLDESDYLEGASSPGVTIEVTLGPEEYFVLGDNRLHSSDSRVWGPLPRDLIIGRAFLRLLPLTAVNAVEKPSY